jgi:hypothetical protein
MIDSTVEAMPEPTPRPLPRFAVELLNCMAFTRDPQPGAGNQAGDIGKVYGSIAARLQGRAQFRKPGTLAL